jgi:DNA polymerase (family 10)
VIADGRRFNLGRAWDLLETLAATLADACPSLQSLTPAGDARRYEPLVSSLILVGSSADPPAALDLACGTSPVTDVRHRTARGATLLYGDIECDLRVAATDEYGSVLFSATGSAAHVDAVTRRRGRPAICASEADVYAHAGLPWIPPELRQGVGEIEAALAGALPALVTREDMRGDLHMHSTWSDGRDTLEDMLASCAALGYEYVAITDHSQGAAASRTVDADDLARQREEVDRLRERYPSMTVLHGIEVDILEDGRLDFSDRLLEPLDIVVASLHERFNQSGRTLTRRCVQAIRHPLVNIISHPANQLVGRREGYDLDFEALYAAAVETGTALEIDGAPGHLDLDGEHARVAIAAGVTITIDSDCHRAPALDRQMRFGVGTARRGWVEPRHVLNTRGIDEVRAFVAAKRRGRTG